MNKKAIENKGKTKQARDAYKEKCRKHLIKFKSECNYSIYTLSILNWWKLHEANDLTFMLKIKRPISAMEGRFLNNFYLLFKQEYDKEVGLQEGEIVKNELKEEIILLYCDMIINDDIGKLTDIEIKEKELTKLENEGKGQKHSLIELAVNIKKAAQVDFNINTCSVAEFFAYIKLLKNGK